MLIVYLKFLYVGFIIRKILYDERNAIRNCPCKIKSVFIFKIFACIIIVKLNCCIIYSFISKVHTIHKVWNDFVCTDRCVIFKNKCPNTISCYRYACFSFCILEIFIYLLRCKLGIIIRGNSLEINIYSVSSITTSTILCITI